jgi:hypothetical protein
MDIHKPKAPHSFREFLSEIGVIVCGIVIALVLDEGVRVLHDRSIAREAREAVHDEIRQNLAFMSGRLATQNCIERRLDEIGDLLAASDDGVLVKTPNWVGQPSIWYLSDQRWQVATASGRASLLPPQEQERLASVYVSMARFNDAERQEQAAWAQLRGLESWHGPLGPVGRVHFAEALQQARYEIWETRITINVARMRAKEIGIEEVAPKVMGGNYSIPHAVCLPIDTPRAKALDILSRDGTPPWGQPK